MQQAETHSHIGALNYLIGQAGARRVAALAGLLVLSSLTEGIGLLMLVPITHLILQPDAAEGVADWMHYLATFPPALLLTVAVALVGVRALIVYLANESRRGLGLSLSRTMRVETHRSILRANWRWLSGQNSADHAALIMGEAVRAGHLVDHALSIATGLITLAVLLAAGALISPTITLITIIAGIVLGGPMLMLRANSSSNAQAYSHAYARLQGLVSNGLSHLRAARIANASPQLERDFEHASASLERHEVLYFRTGYRAQALFQLAVAIVLAASVYFALVDGGISVAIFVPMLAIAARGASMLVRIQQAAQNWNYNLPALAQLRGLIAEAGQNLEPGDIAEQPVLFENHIELSGIGFTYPDRDRPVFDGFGLTIASGTVLGVKGASGAGKSTLADLVSGLLRPDHGSIHIDGIALDAAHLMRWRGQIAYVEQAGFFLDGSVSDNLCWGMPELDEQAMRHALEAASAQFVFDLPNGLATQMGEGGRLFSGGERQRIALARALVRSPDLLILDEISAGLDAQNKRAIITSIDALKGRQTILLLSHDRDMLELADKLIDLDQLGCGEGDG